MIPTSAAKYQLKEEKQKIKQQEQKVLNEEESLLRIQAFYGKGEQEKVEQPKFDEKPVATSISQMPQQISISGISPGEITQAKQPTEQELERRRLSSAKAILQHDKLEIGRTSAKQEMTPRRPERLAQPLSKIGVDYKQLYHKAVGQLGLVDVEFKSKSDDLAKQVLNGRKNCEKSIEQAQEAQLESTAPVVQLLESGDYVNEETNGEEEALDAAQQMETHVDCAVGGEQDEHATAEAIVEEAIEHVSERIETATGAIQTAQTETVISEVQTGLIVENLLKQLKQQEVSREQRRLELIQQVLAEDGADDADEDVTAAEIMAELCEE